VSHITFGLWDLSRHAALQAKEFITWWFFGTSVHATTSNEAGLNLILLREFPKGDERHKYLFSIQRILEENPKLTIRILVENENIDYKNLFSINDEFEEMADVSVSDRFSVDISVASRRISTIQKLIGQARNQVKALGAPVGTVTDFAKTRTTIISPDEELLTSVTIPVATKVLDDLSDRDPFKKGALIRGTWQLTANLLPAELIRKLRKVLEEKPIITAHDFLAVVNLSAIGRIIAAEYADRAIYRSA
jgi:hypothetical protein